MQGLIGLGLKRKEAQVYFALLQLGTGSAQTVAVKAELKRPTVYLILTELMKKGLVMKAPKMRKQMFVARNARELVADAEERLSQAKDVLPMLEAVSNEEKQVRTLYFEGVNGLKEALHYRLKDLRGTAISAFFGSSEDATPDLLKVFHEWNKDVFNAGIKIHSIVPKSDSLKAFRKTDKIYGFLPRFVPERFYTSKTSIDITPFFVRIIMIKEQEAVIIENPAVAKAMGEIFNMLYSKY